MNKESRKAGTEVVAAFCTAVGVFSLSLGALMIVFFASRFTGREPDVASFFGTAAALIFSSLLWFAIARVINLLAQIAHNTKS